MDHIKERKYHMKSRFPAYFVFALAFSPAIMAFGIEAESGVRASGRQDWEKAAWKCLMTRFYLPDTSLLYDYRTGEGRDGLIGCLPTPAEIKSEKPCPTGWTSGMEDSVLNAGPMAIAGIIKWELKRDGATAEDVRRLLSGLILCGDISGIPGFVARSVSPVDGKSFFPNSSRDQYTLFVYAMWRFCRSELSKTVLSDLRPKCVRLLTDVASYAERVVNAGNKWSFLRTDGAPAVVSQMWTSRPGRADDPFADYHMFAGIGVHEALRLPMFYAAAYDITGDAHWHEMKLKYVDDGIRMANGSWAKSGESFAVFQAQMSHRLLYETEKDPVRRKALAALLDKYAGYAEHALKKCTDHGNFIKGNLYVYGTDWRELPTRPMWEKKGCTVPVRHENFVRAFKYLREASEGMLNAQLSGKIPPRECEDKFNQVFGELDYGRVTTAAGVAHAILAYWIREKGYGR